MNFKNTYIKLKKSDKTIERIKEIADKYSQASGCDLERHLKGDYSSYWDFLIIDATNLVTLEDCLEDYLQEITEQDLDNYLSNQLPSNDEDILIDVTKWQCYEHVATVLGHKEATYQLNMVLNYLVHHDLAVNPNVFQWKETPQGKVFWSLIFNNQIPKSY